MKPNPELDPKLDALLQSLRHTTPRDPQRALKARDSFLAEVAQFTPHASRVSIPTQSRLDKWKENFRIFSFGMQKPMFSVLLTVLLALGVVFGGGATTVAAAQAAQPGETLYPIKTWSEDVRLDWEKDLQAKLNLELEYTANRAGEIQQLLATGNVVPQQVLTRFENQNQQALELATGLSDDQAITALERIRDQARLQEQTMTKLNLQDQAAQQTQLRIQSMLKTQEQIAQQGIQDPNWLRQQLRLHDRNRIQLMTPAPTNAETEQTPLSGGTPETNGSITPGSGLGIGTGESQNPWTDGTPAPGSGYGPGYGTGECTTYTPNPQNGNPAQQPGSDNGNAGSGDGSGGGHQIGSGSDGNGSGGNIKP
jgi:type II secretory pathway pseudopilin PulG